MLYYNCPYNFYCMRFDSPYIGFDNQSHKPQYMRLYIQFRTKTHNQCHMYSNINQCIRQIYTMMMAHYVAPWIAGLFYCV